MFLKVASSQEERGAIWHLPFVICHLPFVVCHPPSA